MSTTFRKIGMSITAVAAAGALLAGCSSSDDDGKSDTTSADASSTTAAADASDDSADDKSPEGVPTQELTNAAGHTIEVITPIVDKYNQLGGERGHLKKPVHEQHNEYGGAWLDFQGGKIFWSQDTGAHFISGDVAEAFDDDLGLEEFGFPTDDMTSEDGVQEATFQYGKIRSENGNITLTTDFYSESTP